MGRLTPWACRCCGRRRYLVTWGVYTLKVCPHCDMKADVEGLPLVGAEELERRTRP